MNTTRFWSLPFTLGLIAVVAATMIWRALQPYPIYDVYPVYFGAQAWAKNGNAYNLDEVVDPFALRTLYDEQGKAYTPYEQMHKYGNAYPFPLVAWLLPLSFLPVKVFSIIWIGLLVGLVCLVLRWINAPLWLLAFYPLWQGIRLEQVAILVFTAQVLGVYAILQQPQARSTPWLVALASAIALLKPTQGAVIALALLVMARMWQNWRILLIVFGIIWGLPTLLDPNWISEWLIASRHYRDISQQYIPWFLAIVAVPFALWRDWVSAAAWLQFALSPYTWVYTAVSLPLSQLKQRFMLIIIVLSNFWLYLANILLGYFERAPAEIAAIMLLIGLPLLMHGWRSRE